jgi:RNA polymerase sigma factor (sigma-70 family)
VTRPQPRQPPAPGAATAPGPAATPPATGADAPAEATPAARESAVRELGAVWRECTPRVLAALVRRYGDFDAAEDALQEALLAASRQWPAQGVPADPRAWLIAVASRRLLDQWRTDRARSEREQLVARQTPPDRLLVPAVDDAAPGGAAAGIDDTVTLMVLCCHPVLPPPAQVALTLRAVGGLSTARIARAFLVPEATMAQRISRAKSRLRERGARFTVPPAQELPGRVAAVAHVLYLIFTEGHTSTAGAGLYDAPLATEAIRLARHLHARLPTESEVAGLLALMLLTDARRPARIGTGGALVPLAEQDRTRWDRTLIAEGVRLVEAALPDGPVGPYQLQAAIAAVHAEAPSAGETDWAQIEVLYRMLAGVAPSPVVTLNHAVAIAMVEGAAAGLRVLEPLLADRGLRHNHRLYAVRAHLLERAGDTGPAREAYATAARLATSIPEQRYLSGRANPDG